jgi:uncharacterized protein
VSSSQCAERYRSAATISRFPRFPESDVLLADATVQIPLRAPQAVPAVSARWWVPHKSPAEPLLVLAHGAGSRLDHPLHERVCAAVAAAGVATLGFNFAYAEAGRRSPDPMPRLQAAYRDVVVWVGEQHPGHPLIIGGRSMGGRVASLLAAQGLPVAGLALLNYPLLPANRRPDSAPRTDHWPDLSGPVLFVHGTRDRLLDCELFAAQRHLLAAADVTVHTVEAADHGFAVPKRTGRTPDDVAAEVGGAIAAWVVGLEQGQ